MLYRPSDPWIMWDSWLFEWEGVFHLFHIERHRETGRERVGHAVGDDLVHWRSRPSIVLQSSAGEWNAGWNHKGMKTGVVVRHAGRFHMLLGTTWKGVDVYGGFVSDDLDNWMPYPGNPVLRPQGPHYQAQPTPPQHSRVDWRDPSITYRQDTGYYHALLCARLPQWSHRHSGAVVGHARSRDFVHWEHLPPIDAPTGQFYGAEVPEIFALDGRYYLLFAGSSHYIRLNTPTRDDVLGTVYMIGEAFEGPFTLPDDYLLIGSGHRKHAAWCGRTISYQDGRLLYHHIAADRPTWGASKMIGTCSDGTLYLRYMPALQRLETSVLLSSVEALAPLEVEDFGDWQRQAGALVGQAEVMGSSCRIAQAVTDVHLSIVIHASSAARAGVVLRCAEDKGVAMILDFERQCIEIGMGHKTGVGKVRHYWLSDCGSIDPSRRAAFGVLQPDKKDFYRCPLHHGRDYHLRCFARDEHFEVYLDDRWVLTAVMTEAAKTGDVELVVEQGAARFSDLRLAAIEPLT